ncbi:hypothetical protein GXW78_20845 [Roseomonas terrae]|uniref:Bacteriophage-related protein n=1 Tax=Neoroseomonas terrae TaxID=424799 RepID=A0ABS5EM56_9PROT|nr:hypothetical protein [Neoroseomonas terrae]MBR0652116.1 hypothetical protein [Neoroseomonas terrae]
MSDAAQTLTVVIPLRVKPRGGRKAMVAPGVLALERRQDITLIKAVARAFRWRRMLESGRFATINELAAAEKINSSYVSRVLRLTLLAPDIVEAILDGRQPEGMTLPGLLEPSPPEWEQQRAQWPLPVGGDPVPRRPSAPTLA